MPQTIKVLIAGVSTRAAAASAARAGFDVIAVDAFGDLDQHPAVRCVPLKGAFTAVLAAEAAATIACDAVAYLSSFENHPDSVRALAKGRVLWGNPPDVLRRVRDPIAVHDALVGRGFAVPSTVVAQGLSSAEASAKPAIAPPPTVVAQGFSPANTPFLVKPIASGGGRRVRPWRRDTPIPRGCYLQELIDGTPGSIVFVAAGGRAVPLGISRQLVGESDFGADGYRYCGNIVGGALFERDDEVADRACALAAAVAEEFGLVGINGIDFIARDGVPWPIEVNPRWCGSMELVERAYGLEAFSIHAAACSSAALPDFDLRRARRGASAIGKAIVFARRPASMGDTHAWLHSPVIADVPAPGQTIEEGHPMCTVFAEAATAAACRTALADSAQRVYAHFR